MSDHLPECVGDPRYPSSCICPALRACEARVLDTIRRDSWYEDGWNAALDAARDAVAALLGKTVPPSDGVTEALAAIDALRATP